MKLAYRFGDHWALIEVGKGLTIGLHPAAEKSPVASKGSMTIGIELTGSIHEVVKALETKGVRLRGIISEGKAGLFAHFQDPDGNPLYLAQLNSGHVNKGEGQYQQA